MVPTANISAAPPQQNVNVVNTTADPVPTVAQGTTAVSGSVNVSNTPNVNVANTPTVGLTAGTSVGISGVPTVNIARTLVHDGKAFSLLPDPNIAFEFTIPANVVLTDVVLSLNAPSVAITIFVAEGDNSKTYVFQSVGSASSTFAGSTEGRATINFQSGLQSANGLRVGLTCNNIGGNTCAGALMWSGYQP